MFDIKDNEEWFLLTVCFYFIFYSLFFNGSGFYFLFNLLKSVDAVISSCQQEADTEQERPRDRSSSGRRFDDSG